MLRPSAMLLSLLNEQKANILARSLSRVMADVTLRSTGSDLAHGLPIFFDQLVEMLEREAGPQRGDRPGIAAVAAGHGKDLLRAGFTVSQVVSSYGANRGDLRATNLPGKGCIFTIDLPQ
jgi:hypothetical protein